jgi:hypothetical protein
MIGEETIIIVDGKEHNVILIDNGYGHDIKDPVTRKIVTEGYTLDEAIENYREMVRSNLIVR